MESFTVGDILEATGGRLIKGDPDRVVSNISTDSRTLKEGDLFVALIGERFDGHDFIPQAISRGAMGVLASDHNCIISCGSVDKSSVIIMVEDTMRALGDIARLYRSRFNIPVVGITGSNGKTTTKDMTASVLSQKYNVLKSEGNFNNAIGLPLTLFKLSSAHEVAVVEMGISAPGEMSRLVEIAHPSVAVVTNVNPTHLESLGSIEGVAVEKGTLVKFANSAVLNADDPFVANMRDEINGTTITYGIDNPADVVATDIRLDQDGRSEFTLIAHAPTDGKTSIKLQSVGKYNIYNALAASSVGILFHVELGNIKSALESHKGAPMRMQRIVVNGFTIIDDTYNSNPVSLRNAIDLLLGMQCKGKKVIVAGDMLELGEQSEEFHKAIGRYIGTSAIAMRTPCLLVTVGDRSASIASSAISAGMPKSSVIVCRNNLEAVEHLYKVIERGDVILIKGSRGMRMEEIVRAIEERRTKG